MLSDVQFAGWFAQPRHYQNRRHHRPRYLLRAPAPQPFAQPVKPQLRHSIQPSHTAPNSRARSTRTSSSAHRNRRGPLRQWFEQLALHRSAGDPRRQLPAPAPVPARPVHPTAPLSPAAPCPCGAPSEPTASTCAPCRLCGESCAANTTRHLPTASSSHILPSSTTSLWSPLHAVFALPRPIYQVFPYPDRLTKYFFALQLRKLG